MSNREAERRNFPRRSDPSLHFVLEEEIDKSIDEDLSEIILHIGSRVKTKTMTIKARVACFLTDSFSSSSRDEEQQHFTDHRPR